MREYELLYILNPELDEAQIETEREYVRSAVTRVGGQIKKEEAWGRRPLPFEMKRAREGFFCLLKLSLEPDKPSKLIYELKINDRIIRNMLTSIKG